MKYVEMTMKNDFMCYFYSTSLASKSRRAKVLLELGRRQEAADALQQLDPSNEDGRIMTK